MKFILGIIPNTQSKHAPGPMKLIKLTAEHKGVRYGFERWHRAAEDSALYTSRMRVYDAKDYPDAMIAHLVETGQIVQVG